MCHTVAGSSFSRGVIGVIQLLVATGTVRCPSTCSAWSVTLNSKACPKMSRSGILPGRMVLYLKHKVRKRDNLSSGKVATWRPSVSSCINWGSFAKDATKICGLFAKFLQILGWQVLSEYRLVAVIVLTRIANSSHIRPWGKLLVGSLHTLVLWPQVVPFPQAATPCMRFLCKRKSQGNLVAFLCLLSIRFLWNV